LGADVDELFLRRDAAFASFNRTVLASLVLYVWRDFRISAGFAILMAMEGHLLSSFAELPRQDLAKQLSLLKWKPEGQHEAGARMRYGLALFGQRAAWVSNHGKRCSRR
jgi:hypothetical protein